MSDETFTCPVPWCAGRIDEHGGDGAPPDAWCHTSASEALRLDGATWAWLARFRDAGGPDALTVALHVDAELSPAGAVRMAGQLRGIAARIEAAARCL